MKKNILIILISFIVVLLLILFLFRHHIIGHAFKVSISSKTNKTVELVIGQVHYSLINSSVSFTNSNLKFNNIYINKDKTIELSEFNFDEIELSGLSVFRLLFKDEVVADKFIVSKPSLWFQQNNNPQPFTENPKEIINSLKDHPDLLGDLKVIVDEIEVTHGKVDLKSLLDDETHSGSVEFRIVLRNFNTTKEKLWGENRFLFAKEHLVSLSGFNYQFPNGDRIGFDSLDFLSEKNELDIKNLHLKIVGNKSNEHFESVITKMRLLRITGISLMDFQDLGKIDVDTVLLSDAYIKVKKSSNDSINKSKDNRSTRDHYSKKIKELLVGSLMLNNFNLVYNNNYGDTLAFVSNLDFRVSDILVDSAMFEKQIPKFNFHSVSSEVNRVIVNSEKIGANISFNNFKFNEKNRTITFHDITVNDRKRDSNSVKINAGSIEVSNISLEGFLKKQRLPIQVSIFNPVADIKLQGQENKKKNNQSHKLPEWLTFSNIHVNNGYLIFNKKDQLQLSISGINFNTGNFSLDSITEIENINLSKTNLMFDDMEFVLIKNGFILTSDSLKMTNSNLLLENILLKTGDGVYNNSSIKLAELCFEDCNFQSVFKSDRLELGNVSITSPRIKGNFFHDINKSASGNIKRTDLKYGLTLDKLSLIDGNVDFKVNTGDDVISVFSNINLSAEDIDIDHFNDNSWLQNIKWKLSLENTLFLNSNISVNLENLYSDKSTGILSVNNLKFKEFGVGGVKNNSLQIEGLNLKGVNYYSFIGDDSPIIKSAKITNPTVDLKVDKRSKGKGVSDNKKNRINLPFELDELEIENLALNIEHQNNKSVSYLTFNEVDFKYSLDGSENLFNDLNYLNMKSISFSDSVENKFSTIGKIRITQEEKNVIIQNINGGNINMDISKGKHLKYTSSKCILSDIYIGSSFPVQVKVDNIEFDEFLINIVESQKKVSPKLKQEEKSLKIPSEIAFIDINNFTVNDLDFSHISKTDSVSKEIHLSDMRLLIDTVRVDSVSIDKPDFSFVKSASVEFGEENQFVSKDSLYVTTLSGITYNFAEHKVIVDSLSMQPRYEDSEFFRRAKYQTGKMDIVTDQILCNDFRIDEFIERGKIHFGGIDITGLDTRIYRNKTYEIKPGTYKKLPQEALLSIVKPITIDSLRTHNAYIKYKEIDKKSVVPGEIYLDSFNLSIYNINNDIKVIDNSSTMIAHLNAMLLGQSKLDLKVTFPLLNPSNDFWVEGYVENIDFSGLNSMTQNLVGVTMKRGSGALEIPLISGNSDHSDGSLLFSYNKLKIELYDREKAKNARGLTGSMASLLLNDIFIKSNNPGFLGKTRPGEVYFKRDTQKSVVSYIWKSIMSGLMSTMGYNNKEQRHEKKALRRKNK